MQGEVYLAKQDGQLSQVLTSEVHAVTDTTRIIPGIRVYPRESRELN